MNNNELTQPIYREIQRATTAAALHEISRSRIPGCVGITDDEREQLKTAVSRRFGALNAEAVGQPTVRWA